MKRRIALLAAMIVFTLPITAGASNYTAVDPGKVTHEELVEEYNSLVEKYNILYDLYVEKYGQDSLREYFGTDTPATTKNWVVKYYVDEFNQVTENPYVTTAKDLTGTFSNSATTNSPIKASILVDQNSIRFKILEYGTSVLKAYYTYKFDVTILDGNGDKIKATATIYEGGNTVHVDDDCISDVAKAITRGGEIKIRLDDKEHPATNYIFTMSDAGGFADAFEEAFPGTIK